MTSTTARSEVHGIARQFLDDKPVFADVWSEFLEFIDGAEVIIHNAPFDVSFLNYELQLMRVERRVEDCCSVVDSLALARHKHPGQKNNLDALCRRYEVDNSQRQLHGALLDAEILADVYLLMTGGQTQLFGSDNAEDRGAEPADDAVLEPFDKPVLRVVAASREELDAHEQYLDFLAEGGAQPVWRSAGETPTEPRSRTPNP